jgi:hypothetical protein
MMPPRVAHLRWRTSGDALGVWSALRAAPEQNSGFVETKRYAFEKPGTGWSLRIDDELLNEDPGQPIQWRWEPGFYAGEVTAELVGPSGAPSGLFLLDVAPEPTKMGREIFDRMLNELWSEDPTLVIGSEPATRRIGDLGDTQNAWLEFARFRRYVPEFLRAVVPIRTNPRRALTVRRVSSPLHHVRRVDRRTATSLARSPAVAVLFGGSDDKPTVGGDSRLDVPIVEETLDSAANRAMLALTLALIRRAHSLDERLEGLVEREPVSETRTSLSARWPARKQVLDDLTVRLKVLLRQNPFREVQRPEITATGLTAVYADPGYARAWGRGWRALRYGLESGQSTERLWVSPSWEIYERWCFLRLGQLLAASLPEWGWHRATERWRGAHAGRRAELRLQPTFRSRQADRDEMWSVSRERVPDLVLTVQSAEGARFAVLDAKYRSSRSNVLDAMASAHIYQDSLRLGSRRPEASLLLVPSGGGAPWLEEPAFQLTHRVGVHVLSPDADNTTPEPLNMLFGS